MPRNCTPTYFFHGPLLWHRDVHAQRSISIGILCDKLKSQNHCFQTHVGLQGNTGHRQDNRHAIQWRKRTLCFIIASESVIQQYKGKKLTEINFPFGDVIMIILKQLLFILNIEKFLPKYDLFDDRKLLQYNLNKGFWFFILNSIAFWEIKTSMRILGIMNHDYLEFFLKDIMLADWQANVLSLCVLCFYLWPTKHKG